MGRYAYGCNPTVNILARPLRQTTADDSRRQTDRTHRQETQTQALHDIASTNTRRTLRRSTPLRT